MAALRPGRSVTGPAGTEEMLTRPTALAARREGGQA